jgi:hypothetical protein
MVALVVPLQLAAVAELVQRVLLIAARLAELVAQERQHLLVDHQ